MATYSPTERHDMEQRVFDATAADIDLMTMSERIAFLHDVKHGPAAAFGAEDRWRNMEGVMAFFRDHGMGTPGSWVSHVNAGVLEGIERGVVLALDDSADSFGNPGAIVWARYLLRLREGKLSTRSLHDAAWSEAKEVGTDYGLTLAERRGLVPTGVERRFLLFAQCYNWALRNRPVLDFAVTYGRLFDARLSAVAPEFVDWFTNVGDPIAARQGCEVAYAIAQIEPTAGSTLSLDRLDFSDLLRHIAGLGT